MPIFFFYQGVYQGVQECIKRSEERLRLNPQINLDNSTSEIGSRAASIVSLRQGNHHVRVIVVQTIVVRQDLFSL